MSFGKIHAPLVTVIVVNYNYGRFLDECLMSILHQTYPHIECIVFDNASTDTSRAVLQTIDESGAFHIEGRSLSIIHSERNLYQTPAAVEAFKQATGNFIIFFDADDYMLPSCVETHIRTMLSLRVLVGATCVDYYMSSNDEIVTSTGSHHFSQIAAAGDASDKVLCRNVELPKTSTGSDADLPLSDLHHVQRTMRGWPWSGTCGLCFRREVVELMFRRTPNLREQLDAYLIGGVNSLTGSILIDRPLVVYRHHGSNNFAGRPIIANLHFYDRAAWPETSRAVESEIIETFLLISDELAGRLDDSEIFIEAIDTISKSWSPLPPKSGAPDYMTGFLKENETALVHAFGPDVFARWKSRFAREATANKAKTARDNRPLKRFALKLMQSKLLS